MGCIKNSFKKLQGGVFLTGMLILLLIFTFANQAKADAGRLSTVGNSDNGVYQALLSGQRILRPHDYTVAQKPTVYLTFDDGPSACTPQVLDILKKNGIHATFFVLGEEAERYPDLIKRMVKEGHAVGNHTYNHEYSQLYRSFDQFWSQIVKTEQILDNLAGIRPVLIRAPGGTFGHFDAFYFYYLDQTGFTVNDWNMDSGDSRRRHVPAKEIIDTVEKGPFPKEIHLLMHDGSGHGESVKALPQIIAFFKQKGYQFAKLDDHVKPVTFGLGPVKVHRAMSPERFKDMLAKLPAAAEDKGGAELDKQVVRMAAQTRTVSEDAVQALHEVPSGLRLVQSGQHSEKVVSDYALHRGSFYVPLRDLADWLGGNVEWDPIAKIASFHQGSHKFDYDLRQMTVTEEGTDSRYGMSGIYLDHDTLMVPLRSSVEWLGGKIEHFTAQKLQHQVIVEMKPRIVEAMLHPINLVLNNPHLLFAAAERRMGESDPEKGRLAYGNPERILAAAEYLKE